MSFAGLQAIRSALSNNTYAALPVFFLSIPPAPFVGRQRSNNDSTWPPAWNITAVGEEGSDLYNISSGIYGIIIDRNGDLAVSFPQNLPAGSPSPLGSNFSIESAGDRLVRFQVPDEDLVWTLADDGSANPNSGTRITLEPDTGLTGQRWILESLD